MAGSKLGKNEKALVRRYLLWCYKTTKESVDWIERKFTQSTVDHFVLSRLEKMKAPATAKGEYQKRIDEFRVYISDKEKDGAKQKFAGGRQDLNPEYLYLRNRLSAVEDAIRHFLGTQELARINLMYEQEMTRRILESKEH
jgi:hypothetical protein